MQSLGWYIKRLRAMSAGEIVARVGHATTDLVDRVRLPRGWYPQRDSITPSAGATDYAAGCQLFNADAAQAIVAEVTEARARLVQQADAALEHRLSFFDLKAVSLGDPIDWQRDIASGKRGPLRLIQDTNYRDFSVFGDCKLVWEPSRHHQLVVLARAWRLTGERRYAEGCVAQLEAWIDANPFGYGMNWRSPLELGIRIINWVAALDLMRASGALSEESWQTIYHQAYLHVWEISRKYSPGSSANNHLVGELAGVFVACSYFKDFPDAERLRQDALMRLEAWIADFAFNDGCTPEQALGYQFFVLQFLVIVMRMAERTGLVVSATYKERLEAMYAFPAQLAEGGALPMFGDQDDGYVLDLGDDQYAIDAVLALGAAALQSPRLAAFVQRPTESVRWLFDNAERALLDEQAKSGRTLVSTTFDDAGYCLLQSGTAGTEDSVSALFDCGPLGLGALAAHGHADALSLAIRVGGRAFLIDPGTYDYYSYPEWRHYFRTTPAHNTLCVDETDQSEIQGPFLWGQRAECERLEWSVSDQKIVVVARHDGYTKLEDPVLHTRRVVLDTEARRFEVTDTVAAADAHRLDLYFHFAADCAVSIIGETLSVTQAGRTHTLVLPEGADVTSWHGSEVPIMGWHSPRYHVREAITTVRARLQAHGDQTLVTVLQLGLPG